MLPGGVGLQRRHELAELHVERLLEGGLEGGRVLLAARLALLLLKHLFGESISPCARERQSEEEEEEEEEEWTSSSWHDNNCFWPVYKNLPG